MKGSINHRRVLGTVFLALAIVLLVVGETLLKHKLSPIATLIYWTTCVCLTLGAILCAVLDLGHSFRQSRAEQRQMLEQTIRAIETEQKERKQKGQKTPPESR